MVHRFLLNESIHWESEVSHYEPSTLSLMMQWPGKWLIQSRGSGPTGDGNGRVRLLMVGMEDLIVHPIPGIQSLFLLLSRLPRLVVRVVRCPACWGEVLIPASAVASITISMYKQIHRLECTSS